MPTNTIRLHRVLRATPERVYRAFLDADAMAKWLPPNGFTGKVHHLDAKVGGTYKMSFTNFSTGNGHTFGGEYLELVPNERIRHTDRFDDPNLPGEMVTTISLKPVSVGTDVDIVQEGVPGIRNKFQPILEEPWLLGAKAAPEARLQRSAQDVLSLTMLEIGLEARGGQGRSGPPAQRADR
jgi:uncharacterized protein YndB with AHSA1/START domain